MNLNGKIVSILGAGGSGRAAARLAVARGATVCLYDSKEISHSEEFPTSIKCHPQTSIEFAKSVQSDFVVLSPGIDTFGSFVEAFSLGADEVMGEVEFATRFYDGRIIAITGTNGKTTTTELIQLLVQEAGKSCVACGNYGLAVSEVVNQAKPPEVLALEVSSFQLESIKDFCPDVAIWLNFDADHMDRYKSLADYKSAKLRIFENQTDKQTAIVRFGDNGILTNAKLVRFSSESEVCDSVDYTFDDFKIYYQGREVIDMKDTKLRGLHNAENLMAALAAVEALGLELDLEVLKSFSPPRHRCEFIAEINGVEYINDSKATNLHALDSALRSLTLPILLIAGGKNKGLDYSELAARISRTVKKAFVFGEIADQLVLQFPSDVPVNRLNNLDEAVSAAKEVSSKGDTILFSPGTSSFDMFAGYEQRGDAFVHAVRQLEK